ncbi:hypothetical protein [Peredibacter starrii]|uniref:Uncharacterized protein n=1 Tax=Peredibacter starrii TaxID=28202 RepID=A0AAX4HK86_9BACT|nr:hypothetical protein [Peredibacter starrii]WPU63641.1 hypothetical protein SOO65_13175 [Peredibacter starrii]
MALQNITQFFASSFIAENALTKTLGEEFVLCENRNVVFHWADFFETCDLIKNQMQNDPVLSEDFKNREAALARLALIPVWIRTENKVHQTTMHDLYEKYILNQTQLLIGVDPFCPIELSFISGTGPFKGMSVAECFNKTTYKDFVLINLLKGKLPKRDFRIRLKSKVLMEYGSDFNQAHLVALEQITTNGLLFSVDSDTFMKKISQSPQVRVLLNTEMLDGGQGKELPELKNHLSQFAFNLMYSSRKEDAIPCNFGDFSVQSSFDFSKEKKVYLFISYEKLAAVHPGSVKNIKNFVAHTRELVRNHYQKNSGNLKTA